MPRRQAVTSLCRQRDIQSLMRTRNKGLRAARNRRMVSAFPGRLAQLARASRLHRECRGFEPLTAHFLSSPLGYWILKLNIGH